MSFRGHKRNPQYEKKKTDYINVNDKLKTLGILFTAGYRASENIGTSYKYMRIFLYEEPEKHDVYNDKNYDRIYYNVYFYDYDFSSTGRIETMKNRRRAKRKCQIVRV